MKYCEIIYFISGIWGPKIQGNNQILCKITLKFFSLPRSDLPLFGTDWHPCWLCWFKDLAWMKDVTIDFFKIVKQHNNTTLTFFMKIMILAFFPQNCQFGDFWPIRKSTGKQIHQTSNLLPKIVRIYQIGRFS